MINPPNSYISYSQTTSYLNNPWVKDNKTMDIAKYLEWRGK